jgi:transposase
MYALLKLPRSTVSAVVVKWKRLGATTAQPQSGRPHKLTEMDRQVLMCIAWKNCLSSVATLTTKFQTASGSNAITITVRRELHEMGFKPKIPMRNAMCQLEWCKAHLQGLWSSGNAFSGTMNHASPSGRPTDVSGFGSYKENATCLNA